MRRTIIGTALTAAVAIGFLAAQSKPTHPAVTAYGNAGAITQWTLNA